MEDDEITGDNGLPCGACRYHRRACGPDCIFAPLFPPGDMANFARVRALFGEDALTHVINNFRPEFRTTVVNYMILQARAQAEGSVLGRNLCIANAVLLASRINELFRGVRLASRIVIAPRIQVRQEARGGGGESVDVTSSGANSFPAPAAALDCGDNGFSERLI